MALPLPRVVADVGPGGGLVTAMRGMNALANDVLANQYSSIKNQYAPISMQADAASKLAYARLMGPQFLAKLMGNPDVVANSPDLQNPETTQRLYQAGVGDGTGNSLMQMPGSQGMSGTFNPSVNQNPLSLSRWLTDKLKSAVGGNNTNSFSQRQQQQSGVNPFSMNFSGQGINPQLNSTMAGIANVESHGSQNPYSLIGRDTGNGDRAIGKYQVMASNVPSWTKEAFGSSMTPAQFMNSPEAQEKLAAYMMNKHLNAGNSPQDVGSIWFTGKPLSQAGNVRDVNGTTPEQYINKMNQGMSQYDQSKQQSSPTYAENAAIFSGIESEGAEAGKIRAKDIKELNDISFNADTKQATLDDINDMISSPVIRQIRQTPLLGKHELAYFSKEGTPEQQQFVGRIYAQLGNIVKDSSRDFAGQFRKGEQQLLQGMKPSDSDTVDAMIGKAESLSVMNKLLAERSKLTAKIMSYYHINKGQASEIADSQINGNKIRKQIHDKLNPFVTIRNKKTGETKQIPISESRLYGVNNG